MTLYLACAAAIAAAAAGADGFHPGRCQQGEARVVPTRTHEPRHPPSGRAVPPGAASQLRPQGAGAGEARMGGADVRA